MSDEMQFLQRISDELDEQVTAQSPALQGRLRAARRTALEGRSKLHQRRFLLPGVASALVLTVAISTLWFQAVERPEVTLATMLQAATASDLQLLHGTDEMELYRDLEFYYWLEQEQAHAG